ncbi:hypothetical protein JOB18_009057 [Solea senegalensis]|uniref:Secreted protein n=1 Tax=Solea senegalensis TaxID=28829 RepID=A0AAV6SG59_SOLSE|nr:hypothetical protein JOB18_009057 [Solea senegalensis]
MHVSPFLNGSSALLTSHSVCCCCCRAIVTCVCVCGVTVNDRKREREREREGGRGRETHRENLRGSRSVLLGWKEQTRDGFLHDVSTVEGTHPSHPPKKRV